MFLFSIRLFKKYELVESFVTNNNPPPVQSARIHMKKMVRITTCFQKFSFYVFKNNNNFICYSMTFVCYTSIFQN